MSFPKPGHTRFVQKLSQYNVDKKGSAGYQHLQPKVIIIITGRLPVERVSSNREIMNVYEYKHELWINPNFKAITPLTVDGNHDNTDMPELLAIVWTIRPHCVQSSRVIATLHHSPCAGVISVGKTVEQLWFKEVLEAY